MNAKNLYKELSKIFDIKTPNDDWRMENKKYLTRAFTNGKNKEMGLMIDNTKIIDKVYTATFFSEDVIEFLKKQNAKNALVFAHHAKDWNMDNFRETKQLFTEISTESYEYLRQNKISVYVVHVPLDANGRYGVSDCLARAIRLEIVETNLFNYRGKEIGVICKYEKGIGELQKQFEEAIGHKSFLIKNDKNEIRNGLVAIIGGGGNDKEMYKELVKRNINTYITGLVNAETGYHPAIDALEYAKQNKINILAGTHYSTEKFAPIEIVQYFKDLGLYAEFIPQQPKFTDYTYQKNN